MRDARHWIWHQAPAFKTLDEVNEWLAHRCHALWQETRHPEQKDRLNADLCAAECPHLMPVPFDGFVEQTKRVSSTWLITVERYRYSVPAAFANQPISLRMYAARLVVVAEAQVIAEHDWVFTCDHTAMSKIVYNWRHHLAVVQRKPGALRNGVPFTELPDSFKRLQSRLSKAPRWRS